MAFFFHFLPMAKKQMRLRAKDSAIHEQIAPLRANHIARITFVERLTCSNSKQDNAVQASHYCSLPTVWSDL